MGTPPPMRAALPPARSSPTRAGSCPRTPERPNGPKRAPSEKNRLSRALRGEFFAPRGRPRTARGEFFAPRDSPRAARDENSAPRGRPRTPRDTPRAMRGPSRVARGRPRALRGHPRGARETPRAARGQHSAAKNRPRAAPFSPQRTNHPPPPARYAPRPSKQPPRAAQKPRYFQKNYLPLYLRRCDVATLRRCDVATLRRCDVARARRLVAFFLTWNWWMKNALGISSAVGIGNSSEGVKLFFTLARMCSVDRRGAPVRRESRAGRPWPFWGRTGWKACGVSHTNMSPTATVPVGRSLGILPKSSWAGRPCHTGTRWLTPTG